MAKAKGKRNRRKEKLEFVQDYLPIRDLKNGIIETTDNRYIKILEIEPINFTLRSDEEQFNIISSFASWLKISPMRLQFKSITRRADSDKHISMICEELEHEENPQCKELGEDYIGLIKDVGNREALTRRFFLIFQYEAVGRNESDDYAKIYGMLQTAEQTARAYFMQCGNSIVQSKDPDEATAEILYMFYNRRSCTDEPFSSRVDRIVVDTMAAKKKIIGMDPVPPIRMANFLAPRGIDLSHYNYVVMDGLYYSFLYIKAGGYPSRVRAGWMSSLINAGEGVDIDVHLRRENRSRTIDSITLDEKIFEQIFTCIKIRGALYDTRKTAPVRVYTYTPNISKILSEILACHFCDEMKKIYLQGKIFELIAVYCDEVICKSPTNDFGIRISVEDYNALLKAREFIGENFAHPLTIPIVAKAIAINEQKLKDGFKRCFGVTVNDYVVEKRLEAAIRLLKTGKHTVQEVTWMVGYSHTGYFIELFRKHYGISPGEMLKNNR